VGRFVENHTPVSRTFILENVNQTLRRNGMKKGRGCETEEGRRWLMDGWLADKYHSLPLDSNKKLDWQEKRRAEGIGFGMCLTSVWLPFPS